MHSLLMPPVSCVNPDLVLLLLYFKPVKVIAVDFKCLIPVYHCFVLVCNNDDNDNNLLLLLDVVVEVYETDFWTNLYA